MLNSSLSYVIIRSFPESIFLILAGYILFNLKIEFRRLIKNSLIFLILLTSIRVMPISFGIHTVFSMFIIGVIFYKFENQQIIQTIINVSKIYICLATSEVIYMLVAEKILGVSTKMLVDNTSINSAILSLPSLLIFILLIIGLNVITKKISTNI